MCYSSISTVRSFYRFISIVFFINTRTSGIIFSPCWAFIDSSSTDSVIDNVTLMIKEKEAVTLSSRKSDQFDETLACTLAILFQGLRVPIAVKSCKFEINCFTLKINNYL